MSALLHELGLILRPDQILAGEATARVYRSDAYTVDRFPPDAVVLPESTDEAAQVVRACVRLGIPFTPRGAGTGLSGGAMPALGGVVVSTKRLNQILEIDVEERAMLAQSGCVNAKLSQAVAAQRLHFAPDPSSQTVSTLGGNIAENSGGPHTLKYGVTAPHILGVTMVQPDGSVVTLGGRLGQGTGFDLLSLVVGSEGTLGIVTEAWIRLTPLPAHVETVLAAFDSYQAAAQTVADIIRAGILPAALEMMDRFILAAVTSAFGITYPEGTQSLLLIECDGPEEEARAQMSRVLEITAKNGALSAEAAKTPEDRAKLWMARKKGVGAMGRLAPTIVTHDGVIPPSRLPEMLEFVYLVAAEAGVGAANLFHAGDGNLHPIFYFDEREPGKVDAVVRAGERIIRKCLEWGGSATGEHGVGVEKAALLRMMFDESSMRLQEDARKVFHESPLCNPCKVIPSGKGCVEHQVRWRGAAT